MSVHDDLVALRGDADRWPRRSSSTIDRGRGVGLPGAGRALDAQRGPSSPRRPRARASTVSSVPPTSGPPVWPAIRGGRRRSRSSTAWDDDLAPLPGLGVPGDGPLDRLGADVTRQGSGTAGRAAAAGADLELHQAGVLVHRDDLAASHVGARRRAPVARVQLGLLLGSNRYSRPQRALDLARAASSVRASAARQSRSSQRSSIVMSWRSNIRHHIGRSSRRWNSTSQPTSSSSRAALGVGSASREPRSTSRAASSSAAARSGMRLARRLLVPQRIGHVADPALALPVQQPAPQRPGGLAVHLVVVADALREPATPATAAARRCRSTAGTRPPSRRRRAPAPSRSGRYSRSMSLSE